MRYMMLIYSRETDTPMSAEEMEDLSRRHREVIEETARIGIFRGAEPLRPTTTATTLRRHAGQVLATDGPFAETKEQLAGYYILDCKNLDEAIHWGSRIPTGCKGREGCVEVRPVEEVISCAIADMARQLMAARD